MSDTPGIKVGEVPIEFGNLVRPPVRIRDALLAVRSRPEEGARSPKLRNIFDGSGQAGGR
jgi:hypothetical protein